MNIEEIRGYCIQKKGVTESFPFDDKALFFKAMNKLFVLTNVENCESVNLKCDPEKALELREQFMGIQEGYHMSKKHWNTLLLESDVKRSLLLELIDHGYNLIVSRLTKKEKEGLSQL
ncbi:MAG: putative DNA-binding protein (MmcQ/YjbR family) [Vicingaceae bacterium]|jgi:predicted DNA-binding protein (MmcQ/YjbR family)